MALNLCAFGGRGLRRLSYLKQWKDRERSQDSREKLTILEITNCSMSRQGSLYLVSVHISSVLSMLSLSRLAAIDCSMTETHCCTLNIADCASYCWQWMYSWLSSEYAWSDMPCSAVTSASSAIYRMNRTGPSTLRHRAQDVDNLGVNIVRDTYNLTICAFVGVITDYDCIKTHISKRYPSSLQRFHICVCYIQVNYIYSCDKRDYKK